MTLVEAARSFLATAGVLGGFVAAATFSALMFGLTALAFRRRVRMGQADRPTAGRRLLIVGRRPTPRRCRLGLDGRGRLVRWDQVGTEEGANGAADARDERLRGAGGRHGDLADL